MKLVRVENHYVIVDSDFSKAKAYLTKDNIIHINTGYNYGDRAITHSTKKILSIIGRFEQSLLDNAGEPYPKNPPKNWYVQIIPIDEIEQLINGYSVEQLGLDYASKFGSINPESYSDEQIARLHGFIDGFNAHKELVKDKIIISKEQLEDILYTLLNCERYEDGAFSYVGTDQYRVKITSSALVRKFVNPLLPQTEWSVEFDENNKLKLI